MRAVHFPVFEVLEIILVDMDHAAFFEEFGQVTVPQLSLVLGVIDGAVDLDPVLVHENNAAVLHGVIERILKSLELDRMLGVRRNNVEIVTIVVMGRSRKNQRCRNNDCGNTFFQI